jgi:hypothetical protein
MTSVKSNIELAVKQLNNFSNLGNEQIQVTDIFNQYSDGGNCATFDMDGNLLETSARKTAKLTCDYVSFGESSVEVRIDGKCYFPQNKK